MLFCAAIVFACNSEDLTAGGPLFQIMGQRVTDNSRAVGLDLVGFFTEKNARKSKLPRKYANSNIVP